MNSHVIPAAFKVVDYLYLGISHRSTTPVLLNNTQTQKFSRLEACFSKKEQAYISGRGNSFTQRAARQDKIPAYLSAMAKGSLPLYSVA
jgi:hypothetical protein